MPDVPDPRSDREPDVDPPKAPTEPETAAVEPDPVDQDLLARDPVGQDPDQSGPPAAPAAPEPQTVASPPVPLPPPPADYPPAYQMSPAPPMTVATPHPGTMMVVSAPSSGIATASLVLGIVGLFTGWCLCLIPNLLAIIFGHMGLSQTKSGALSGRGMAVAGLIMGYIAIVPILLFLFAFGGLGLLGSVFSAIGVGSAGSG